MTQLSLLSPLFSGVAVRSDANAAPVLTSRAIAKCPHCGNTAGVALTDGGCDPVPCPTCRTRCEITPVRAVHSDHPCDARCMGAVGPDCSCSCGGRNHGRARSFLSLNDPLFR